MKPTRFVTSASGVSERICGFMASLRDNGVPVGVNDTRLVLRAIALNDITDSESVRLACKAVCATRADIYKQFDELFDAFWFNQGRQRPAARTVDTAPAQSERSRFHPGVNESAAQQGRGELDQPDNDGDSTEASSHSGPGKLTGSRITNIEKVDLRELMTPDAIEQAEDVAQRLARAIRDRRSRRRRAAKRGASIDLRKVMRASISSGGEPLRLYKRRTPDRPVHLVALLDVSGSMMVYSRIFLAFLKGLVSHDQRTDAYLFHTKLVRVSDALRDHDTLRAVNRLSLMAQGFGGGTRIGSNLHQFNQQYAAQTVTGRSVVIIFSDGYDTDPPDVMAQALNRLKKRGCRIVWLNPLKGWRDYAPVAQGMAAALPFLDLFAAANTLENLADLESHLARV